MRKKFKFKKWLSKYKYIFLILLGIALWFLIPPFINLMMNTPPIFFADFFGFVNAENASAWIGFYGAIIGGVITLFGVAWTIIDQNKKRENDMKDALKPILIANQCKNEGVRGIKGVAGAKIFECSLEYKNAGKGILYNPRVFNIKYSVDGKEQGVLNTSFSVKSSIDINDVADNTIMIEFDPETINSIIQSLKGRGNTIKLNVEMYVGGKDIFGRDILTKLYYETGLVFFSQENIEQPLFRGKLTSESLFSEEEINDVIKNANPKYNVHL